MDEQNRQRLAGRVVEVSAGKMAREEIERALELVPQPLSDRVRVHDQSTLVELVTKTRLFTATVMSGGNDHAIVKLTSRRLDDGLVAVEMEQRGGRRDWTFQFGKGDPVIVNRTEDEAFARALAGCLGWAPDSDPEAN
jgi:hypothetical protein